MSGRLRPRDDMLDRSIRLALAREADRLAAGQPRADLAVSRLAERLSDGASASRFQPGVTFGSRVSAMAWLVVVLTMLLAAVVVGAFLLRDQRPSIVTGPYGPGSPCEISFADGRLLEYRSGFTVLTIDESGTVLRVVDNIFADFRSPLSAGLEVDLSVRRLSAAGLRTVRERIEALGIGGGCHAVRADDGGSLVARTSSGLVNLSFSNTHGSRALAPQASDETARILHQLHLDLTDLDRWLGPGELTAKEAVAPDRWLVMILLSNEQPALELATEFAIGLGPFPGSREHTPLALPGDVAPELFGQALGAADAGPELTRRCGTVSTAEAAALADSLNMQMRIGGGGADMYIWLEPAIGSWQDCDQLADVMGYGNAPAPGPVETPAAEGDLAAVDPCSLVPADLHGPIERSYGVEPPPFGVAARSCLLLETQAMGNIRERHVVWLYPRSVSELDADVLARSMFGAGVVRGRLNGVPTWANHCLTITVDCTGGLAAWHGGRFVLVEVLRLGATAGRAEPAERIMAAVLERLRGSSP